MTGPVLITGGAGSVGRALAARFRADGRTVRVFDLPNVSYAGLEGEPGIEVLKGDITVLDTARAAVQGVSAAVHLAALLPPSSERNRKLTIAVNVDGTEHLVKALEAANPDAPFVFSSSVSTYGDTTKGTPPVRADHQQQAIDVYAESKIAAESLLKRSKLRPVILRIAGIAVPAFAEPPAVWPFMADQRMEFVHRDDVVSALHAAVSAPEARGKVFNIAGGPTWQTIGRVYVADVFNIMGVSPEEARFRDSPGWCDWYDTAESQRILKYQNNRYQDFLGQLQAEVRKLMEG